MRSSSEGDPVWGAKETDAIMAQGEGMEDRNVHLGRILEVIELQERLGASGGVSDEELEGGAGEARARTREEKVRSESTIEGVAYNGVRQGGKQIDIIVGQNTYLHLLLCNKNSQSPFLRRQNPRRKFRSGRTTAPKN